MPQESEPRRENTARVLFVCVENSCRSQMAEGFARALGGVSVTAGSAGSRPSGTVNPRATALMAERGVDLSGHASTGIDSAESQPAWDVVVTMGCGDTCPSLPTGACEDWDLPDPALLDDDGFRRVRDEIEARVRQLLAGRGVTVQP